MSDTYAMHDGPLNGPTDAVLDGPADPATSRILQRLINLVVIGVVSAVDLPRWRVRVEVRGRMTGWIPWFGAIGHNFRAWAPPRIGTQVVMVCPSGDLGNAVVVQTLYTDALPPPDARAGRDVIQFEDGTRIVHDADAKTLTLSALKAEGTLILEGRNIVQRVGEGGYLHTDHAGRASRITHEEGGAFKSETWTTGSEVAPTPDQGFQAHVVLSPDEPEGS